MRDRDGVRWGMEEGKRGQREIESEEERERQREKIRQMERARK